MQRRFLTFCVALDFRFPFSHGDDDDGEEEQKDEREVVAVNEKSLIQKAL